MLKETHSKVKRLINSEKHNDEMTRKWQISNTQSTQNTGVLHSNKNLQTNRNSRTNNLRVWLSNRKGVTGRTSIPEWDRVLTKEGTPLTMKHGNSNSEVNEKQPQKAGVWVITSVYTVWQRNFLPVLSETVTLLCLFMKKSDLFVATINIKLL